MTREEAIAIIRKEYLCVDRDCDIERSCGKCDLVMPDKEPILEAYKMAIKALEQEPKTDTWSIKDVADTLAKHGLIEEQEPCEDCISRQAVLEQINCWIGSGEYGYTNATYYLMERVKHISSVNPQKIGHWIVETGDRETGYGGCTMCSECSGEGDTEMDYCPNCGAKMFEPQESEESEWIQEQK